MQYFIVYRGMTHRTFMPTHTENSHTFPIHFAPGRNSVCCEINRKSVITVQIWFDLTRFKIEFSVCTESFLWKIKSCFICHGKFGKCDFYWHNNWIILCQEWWFSRALNRVSIRAKDSLKGLKCRFNFFLICKKKHRFYCSGTQLCSVILINNFTSIRYLLQKGFEFNVNFFILLV